MTLDVAVHDSTRWPTAAELVVKTLGECRYVSPLAAPHAHEPFVDEMRRVLLCSDAVELGGMGDPPSSFEPAGPRARIFFEHEALTDMLVGVWNQRFTHVPIPVAVAARRRLAPRGELWQRVLESTWQAR
ncbi:MAG TPA: hypothetical protein VN945_08285 [Gemmatimonadales bacterium]|nr:hypothetical protein [Gemmatimonadales bacterium]